MTPEIVIERITTLVREQRDREALNLWERLAPEIVDLLSTEQLLYVGELLETAATAVMLADAGMAVTVPR